MRPQIKNFMNQEFPENTFTPAILEKHGFENKLMSRMKRPLKSCNVATMNGITIANYSHDTGRKVLLVN